VHNGPGGPTDEEHGEDRTADETSRLCASRRQHLGKDINNQQSDANFCCVICHCNQAAAPEKESQG